WSSKRLLNSLGVVVVSLGLCEQKDILVRLRGPIRHALRHRVRLRVVCQHARSQREQVRFIGHPDIPELTGTRPTNRNNLAIRTSVMMIAAVEPNLAAEDGYAATLISSERRL